MKILSRFSFCVLCAAFSLFLTTGYVHSAEGDNAEDTEVVLSLEEARALIEELPTYIDATSGTVPEETGLSFYDIYSRQIAFRENTKAFRASLEARRENYKKIYIDKRDAYKVALDKIYKAEIAAYQEEISSKGQNDEADGSDSPEITEEGDDILDENGEVEPQEADVEAGNAQSEGGLKEEEIPPKHGEEETVKKKVVTSDDAPDFNPSDLSNEEDDEWNDADDMPVDEDVSNEEPMAGDAAAE